VSTSGMPGFCRVPAGVTLVDGPTAALAANALALAIHTIEHRDGCPVDPRLKALQATFRQAGEEWCEARTFRSRNIGIPDEGAPVMVGVDMTTEAAAELLGSSTRAVRGLAQRGTLPGRKVGGSWLFERADVVAHLERTGAA